MGKKNVPTPEGTPKPSLRVPYSLQRAIHSSDPVKKKKKKDTKRRNGITHEYESPKNSIQEAPQFLVVR